MWVFRLGNEIRKRREEEDGRLMEKYAEMEAKYQAQKLPKLRGRRMEEEEKRKGEKEKLKHEKCPWQRHFKRQTVWVEFQIGGTSYWIQTKTTSSSPLSGYGVT